MTSPDDVVPGEHPLQLPIEVEALGDDVVAVVVRGEVDLTESGELRAVLNDACTGPHHTVLLDLRDVRFMGSTGMGVLAEVSHRLTGEGRRLRVEGASPAIRRAFEIAGLAQIFDA